MHKLVAAVALVVAAALVSRAQAEERVDTALVVAIDSSNSIDRDIFNLQFRATLAALESPLVLRAIGSGYVGCIAATIVTWSNRRHQDVVAPWTRICGDDDMLAFVGRVRRPSYSSLHHHGSTTSITGAVDFSMAMLEACPFPAGRQVIDISGNGVDSSATAGAAAQLREYRSRADVLGIVINGLPMLTPASDDGLLDFYHQNVVTPTGFMIVATGPEHFRQAIERKFWLEIAAPSAVDGVTHDPAVPPPSADGRRG